MVTDQVVHKILAPDLMKYPSKIEVIQPDQWNTIGDLHGNPLKLLYFMIAVGAVKMSQKDYESYAKLYVSYTPPDKTKFNKMEALLGKMTVVPGARIRDMGDDFGDRGRDDGLMSSLIHKFQKGGGNLEVILSNHGAVYIMQMEFALYMAMQTGEFDAEAFKNGFCYTPLESSIKETDPLKQARINKFYRSLIGLQQSLLAGVITPESLVEQYNLYKEKIKIYSYDYLEEANGEPVIYSHASASKGSIIGQSHEILTTDTEALLTQANITSRKNVFTQILSRPCNDSDMIPFVDAMNSVLSAKAAKNEIYSLLKDDNNESTLLLGLTIENRNDPKDDNIRNNHGHHPVAFGKRKTLDSLCGQEDSHGKFYTQAPAPEYHCDLTYTKTYATSQAACLANAARVSSSATKYPVDFAKVNNRKRDEPEAAQPKYGRIDLTAYKKQKTQ